MFIKPTYARQVAGAGLARVALRYALGSTAACGDVTVGGDHQSTHVGVDVLEGPNAIVLIAQIDLGMAGDVTFDTVRQSSAVPRARPSVQAQHLMIHIGSLQIGRML